jgi:glycosyltransferase involved in cell wall biosynthesis
LPWGRRIRNFVIPVGRRELYWQPYIHLISEVDLVIVEQASRLLTNYLLFALNRIGVKRMAFWGHGRNFQADSSSAFGETLKRYTSRRVHWWFAYNELSARIISGSGFPADRITVVENAIDTRGLKRAAQRVRDGDVEALRDRLGVRGENVCIYMGGMYQEKRLDYLIEACHRIRARVPDFEMIFVGAGPEDHVVREATASNRWMHYGGPVRGEERAAFSKLCKYLLVPGVVGLVVLDAFALAVPLITTDGPGHGPEIDYLVDGVNGVIVGRAPDPQEYAAVVSRLLVNEPFRRKLTLGCSKSADRYTLENMVDRFSLGVMSALEVSGCR